MLIHIAIMTTEWGCFYAQSMVARVRNDMDKFEKDPKLFTKSLGCWSGFHAQQMVKAVLRHHGTLERTYIYVSGWMIAATRNSFGPLPDQSLHEKTAVPNLIQEIVQHLTMSGQYEQQNYMCPIIADIDAGYGNAYATYLLAKRMILAGASVIQIENQASDLKQCGHQDGKVVVPHDEFIAKIKAVRAAFEDLGISDGVILARTDSVGASLTSAVPSPHSPHWDHFLSHVEWDAEGVHPHAIGMADQRGKFRAFKRIPKGLFKFKQGTGEDRAIYDCIQNIVLGGADLLWIETSTPNIDQMRRIMDKVRGAPGCERAMLVYNNSPSFNWSKFMSDEEIRSFQPRLSAEARVFHHLVTLPTFHTTALMMDILAEKYFGYDGMFGYVQEVQRKEIERGVTAVRHQTEVGTPFADGFQKRVLNEQEVLLASGPNNTMNQF